MGSSSNPLIYLASASPRRSALLDQIGVAHRVRAVDVDETVLASEPPERYVRRLAQLKAETLWERLASAERQPVLGADTAVVLDAEILGKPHDERDCVRMLGLLSARTHQVFTAVALRASDGCRSRVNVSEVTFRALGAEEIRGYWRSGEPADKAGAYAVQGRAALFIERIAGSYSGIMGLPLFETGELLAAIGARA
ncbi:MAG TPA: Maf family protein [Steroidobacteraceae bacterium]|nr:Maf family protein [Steroidobacteraceae bacterium]